MLLFSIVGLGFAAMSVIIFQADRMTVHTAVSIENMLVSLPNRL